MRGLYRSDNATILCQTSCRQQSFALRVTRRKTWRRAPALGVMKAAAIAEEDKFAHLTAWVEEHGGYVHPALTLSESPTYGCRAVVTTEDIDEELVSQEPLLLVPEELSISTNLAKQHLAPILQASSLPSLEGLDAVLPLALFMAYERSKGQGSFWQPYLGLLPDKPGCAWLMEPAELDQALQAAQSLVGSAANDWDAKVQDAKASVSFQANALAQAYGKALQIDAGDILWAMGQVLSRCFGQEPDLAMLPFTDLCNHSPHAMAPNSYTGVNDGRPFVFVSSIWDDAPHPLQAGDELFISYMANTPPVTAFLNLGFVPEELLAGVPSTKLLYKTATQCLGNLEAFHGRSSANQCYHQLTSSIKRHLLQLSG